MLDWFQFHFNPEPISGFALDLISSQYNTIVYFPRFTLTRGARWFARSRRVAHQLITSLGNQNCSMTRCNNFPKLLSLEILPGKLLTRATPVCQPGSAPGGL